MYTVSVIIPTYNRAGWIREAIESVRNQTLQDFEIIVVDDGSTDTTAGVVAAIGDSRVSFLTQSHRGVSAARNLGIQQARGKYIAFLDSDDLFFPDKLARQVAYLDAHPEIGLLYTAYESLDSAGCRKIHPPAMTGWVYKELLHLCTIATPTVMIPAGVLAEAGGFDEALHLAEDQDLWVRIARRYEVAALQEPLVRVRVHEGGIPRDPAEILEARLHVTRKAFDMSPELGFVFRRRLLSRVHLSAVDQYFKKKQPRRALPYLLRAGWYSPFLTLRFVVNSGLRCLAGVIRT